MMKILLSCTLVILLTNCRNAPKLPAFSILLSDSTTIFNTAEIPYGKPSVLIQFSADCKECQDETSEILQHMASLDHANFYFVTYEKFDRLKLFIEHFDLATHENIIVGQDFNSALPKHFKTRGTPMLAVYDTQKRLKAVFEGKADIQQLIKTINNK